MQVHNYIIVIENITLDFLINYFWNQKHANLFVIMKSNLHVKLHDEFYIFIIKGIAFEFLKIEKLLHFNFLFTNLKM
jgi:hypothetical protein